ncbi:MAG TPA: MtrB/PioB family decaheme-associated outer membrane protein [Noviherbaspirillum sp.]|nr:MtrB/PioB family decaheme-associated outer membrane protein [Noviherbaspirillum sp.]
MNTTYETRFTRTILAASIAAICASMSLAAHADDEVERLIRPDSEVELGVGYVSEDSFRFGRYTGLEQSGVHVIGNILINKRGDDASYIEVDGRNLGIDSRSLGIRGGQQGNYGIRLEYDELPYLSTDSFLTPYNGAGTTRLTQPSGVADGATVGAMTGLAANMKPFPIETKRKSIGLGFTKDIVKGWDVEFNFKSDDKDGNKLTAAIIQIGTGGSRGAAIVPEPINYTTDQYEALARYTGEKLQVQVGYYASIFNNANKSLTWDNLFIGTGNATGRYGLPPENEFHQVNASASYALNKQTRLSGNLSFGRMTQNDMFLPYSTVGTGGAAFATEPRPTSGSLNGKVYTINASLKLNTKLMPKLAMTAGWRFDDRDNKTPIAQFDYVTADRFTTGATSSATSNLRRFNMPLDIRKQVLFADFDYHLASATTLKFGYDFHKVDHNYEPTTGDKEHTVKGEVRHRFGETVSARVNYAYSDRNASGYNGAAPLAYTYTSGYLATLVGPATGKSFPWLEAPTLRKYFLADRKRDKLGTTFNFAPAEQLDLQFDASYVHDKYPDTLAGIGLTKAVGWSASFDATLQATETVTGNFFVSLDQYRSEQNGANITTAALATAAETGRLPEPNLGVTQLTDRTFTFGVGARYKPRRNYEVGGNLTHSDSHGRSVFSAGSAIPVAPLPDLESRLNRAELYGKYFLKKDVTLNVRYMFERYTSSDWAWDAPLNLTSVTSVVGTGITTPSYNVHFVGVSVAYQF